MLEKYIENPAGLSFDDLQNNEWQLIKLDITVDVNYAMSWVQQVQENFQDCIFTWDQPHLINEEVFDHYESQVKKLLVRTDSEQPQQWALQWSYQRDGVLPFVSGGIANKQLFPEAHDPDFFSKWNKILKKYHFGFWKEYYELLGEDVFDVSRLVRFPKDCGLNTHVDTGKDQPFLIRMHTVPEIGPDHFFNFGEDLTQDTHSMKPGCVYLLNTGIPHSAINRDNKDWWMLHNNPRPDAITRLLNTKEHVG